MIKINKNKKHVKIEQFIYNYPHTRVRRETRYQVRDLASNKIILSGVKGHGYRSFMSAVKAYEYRYGKDALQAHKIIN